MNNTTTAMPVLMEVAGTPQEMRESIAKALVHPHLLSFTFLGSVNVSCGRMTSVHPGKANKDTQVRVTLTNGDRVTMYLPCRSESATITAHLYAFGTPEHSVSNDV